MPSERNLPPAPFSIGAMKRAGISIALVVHSVD